MAVEKKSSKGNLFDDGKIDKTDSPLEFLHRTGVTSQIKEGMKLLLDNRPEDPIAFLVEYFDNQADTSTALIRAHQKLCLVPYSKPGFYDNLVDAYDLLRSQKGSSGLRGLTGKSYNDILTLLSRDLSSNEVEPLIKRITCFDYEVVRFSIFRRGVLSLLIYQDFLKLAESLYCELDLYERGKADKQLCELCLRYLKEAVTNSSLSDPISLIQAGALLSSNSFQKAALEVLYKGGHDRKILAKEDFIKSAAEIFLSQISVFK
ncbi:tubulin polyglutamylase complex subunit 1-like isoform X2 [Actinia tenebrosa]|uniref:Tubulin polyglutamylase complex subunit 1-like isoform X2 n=1 Tax=Actinia tenebrosa TaxID=6105 RepID=A0A6P8HWI8_ACTTE|nr:tubulin polyglutamylase complex subunit 1-like isoform X2 [Actinia tenebrosa]